ncbi:MAG: oligopeptide/dipeptide ABC transporter ATP-binding protein [Thermodesulfobacteriota bacterium]|nr:oligopeptide/dipeptide ABC transporter ATP-binding protein [Thermodesulfobacteriota bacterium]
MATGKANRLLLSVEGLKKHFPVRRGFFQRAVGWIKAVDGLSLAIAQGQTLGLVGESGCGKSTVGRTILKLLEPDGGRITYKGRDITGLSPHDMRPLRREMQMVFQDPYGSLNPRMTIGASIEEGLRACGVTDRGDRRDGVGELLEMVGMAPGGADRYPHEFSGGQRQRVVIARALSVRPALIVCDEPISALDVSIQAQIINLLKALQERLGLSYLFISHDLNVVGYLCDVVAVMYLGQIMEYGPADALYETPLHPYTLALLSAAPGAEPHRPQWKALSGDVPSPLNPPPGCKFQGRCPLAEERCRAGEIDFHEPEDGHGVRCWKVAGT